MKKQLKDKSDELNVIRNTTCEQMWDTDLVELRQNVCTEWEKADKDELAARQVKAEKKAGGADGKAKKGKGKGAKKAVPAMSETEDDFESDSSTGIVKPSAPPPIQKKISMAMVLQLLTQQCLSATGA